MKPLRYMTIMSSSVIRNIQIDLKYKFLLMTDVAWLIIDVFAFTLLGGMVDSATDVTYSMDVNADIINEDLHIFIYDVNGRFFSSSNDEISIMESIGDNGFSEMEGISDYPELSISINGNKILDWNSNDSLRYRNPALNYSGKRFILPLSEISEYLDNSSYVNQLDIKYNHTGDINNRIEEDQYFAYDSFYYLPAGETSGTYDVIADPTVDSVMDEEGLKINVFDTDGKRISNASVYIDGDYAGKTNGEGVFSWEPEGDKITHFRNKGIHNFQVKFTKDNETRFSGGKFLMGSPKNRLGIDYDLQNFFLVGVLFWAFFGKSYEDTVNTIPEEASKGTIGFLVTNNVSISTLLLSRNMASSVKTFIITMIFIIPPFFFLGVFEGFELIDIPLLLLIFGIMWFFMLIMSLLISSLNIIFKKITPAAMMVQYALKVLTGYYFPLEALDEYVPGLSNKIKFIPLVKGVYLIRDVIIIGKDANEAMGDIKHMFIVTVALAVFSFIFYKILEYKSQRWGTLEFY